MENFLVKAINDTRAMSDIGSALFVKKSGDSKYRFWMALTNIPATGSENETIDTTVTTSRTNTSTPGRSNPGQKSCTFMSHRDNWETLKEDHNKTLDFLQINPDGIGFKFSGKVTSYQDEVTVGSNLTGKAVITVTSAEELPVSNVTDIIMDTVIFESSIDGVVKLSTEEGKNKYEITVQTNPADATVDVTSDTEGVVAPEYKDGVLTLTGTAKGSAIVKLTASKDVCASGRTHILVVVE